jgi:ankyrin repeat protein
VLHYAVLSGNLATVNLLIKQGARVNYPPDYQKPTPLDLAILKGDIDLVKLLLAAGKGLRLQCGICMCHVIVYECLPFPP